MNGHWYTIRFVSACIMVCVLFTVDGILISRGFAGAAAPLSGIFGGAAALLAVGKIPTPGGNKPTGKE